MSYDEFLIKFTPLETPILDTRSAGGGGSNLLNY
jgi:hypothetical protein